MTVDGRAGSGKSTLADQLLERVPHVTLVRLDDVYPGWQGLAAAIDTVRVQLVEPVLTGQPGHWPRWDWSQARYTAQKFVAPGSLLLVEGCGATAVVPNAHRQGTGSSVLSLWVDTPDLRCQERLRARDGHRFDKYWPLWDEQWQKYLDDVNPRLLTRDILEL